MARKIRRNRKIRAKRRVRAVTGIHADGWLNVAIALTAVIVLSVFLIFCHDWVTQCAVFEAERITVAGGRRLAEADILAQAQISPGMNIVGLNLALARKRLLAHPWIAEAEIRREIPSGLEIRIAEHHPLAVIDLGRKFLIDEAGTLFKEMDALDPPDLPLVQGLRFSDLHLPTAARIEVPQRSAGDGSEDPGPREGSIYDAVMRVLRLGFSENGAISGRAIKKILVDRELGLTLVTAHRRTAIKLGFDEFPLKYQVLQKIFDVVDRGGILNLKDVTTIDLKNLNRVVLNPTDERRNADG